MCLCLCIHTIKWKEDRISVNKREFTCAVCLDLLKDPVTIQCGTQLLSELYYRLLGSGGSDESLQLPSVQTDLQSKTCFS